MSTSQTQHLAVTTEFTFVSGNNDLGLFRVCGGIPVAEAVTRACITLRCALHHLEEVKPNEVLLPADYFTIKYLVETSDALLFSVNDGLKAWSSSPA